MRRGRGGGGSWIQISCYSLSSGSVSLLSYSLATCPCDPLSGCAVLHKEAFVVDEVVVFVCCEKHYSSNLYWRLQALQSTSDLSCMAHTPVSKARSCREASGKWKGCCSASQCKACWWLLPCRCFFKATAVCPHSSRANLKISVEGKKLSTDQSHRGCREHHPLGEGILPPGGVPPAGCFPTLTTPSLHCVQQPSHSAFGWPLLCQKSLRKAVLVRPQALHGALLRESLLMLCCKCILFKGCTNYKSVLGDESKNIFSWLISVNNL